MDKGAPEKKRAGAFHRRAVYLILVLLAGLILATLFSWRYYMGTVEKAVWDQERDTREYDRHYVMITDESSSPLWDEIYRSAKEKAAEQNACLELLGEWAAGDYTAADYMNIAVASGVDGILVRPDGSEELRLAIDRAEEQGIPVITVMEDDSASARTSFVGLNSYQTGTIYGEQILRCVGPETRTVAVLLNWGDAGKELVLKQLKATVQEGLDPEQQVEVNSFTVDTGNTFDGEELIRNLFYYENSRPDILVCMNEMDSECAYYALVDYNQVGSVELIGYYQSGTMLAAVQKGVISMVITPDAAQVGVCCVEALEEYYSMGYTSSYFSVDLNIITRKNVGQFLTEEEL